MAAHMSWRPLGPMEMRVPREREATPRNMASDLQIPWHDVAQFLVRPIVPFQASPVPNPPLPPGIYVEARRWRGVGWGLAEGVMQRPIPLLAEHCKERAHGMARCPPPYGVLWVARSDGQARKPSNTQSASLVPEAPVGLDKDVQPHGTPRSPPPPPAASRRLVSRPFMTHRCRGTPRRGTHTCTRAPTDLAAHLRRDDLHVLLLAEQERDLGAELKLLRGLPFALADRERRDGGPAGGSAACASPSARARTPMRVPDWHHSAQRRSAKQKSKRNALQ